MDNPEKLTTLGTQDTRRRQTKQNTKSSQSLINLVFIASPLNAKGLRAKPGWLGIMLVCPTEGACLLADCCFSELKLKIQQRWSSTNRTSSSSH